MTLIGRRPLMPIPFNFRATYSTLSSFMDVFAWGGPKPVLWH